MAILSAAELACMRSAFNSLLPDTCTVSRYTVVSDNAGGQTQTWATVATVACRLSTRNARPTEGDVADRMQNANEWMITVPSGTDVRTEDRIAIGSRTFEVAKPLAHSEQTALRVIVTEIV